MEALVGLGALVLGANYLVADKPNPRQAESATPTPLYDFLTQQYERYGALAPSGNSVWHKLPWSTHNPPDNVMVDMSRTATCLPTERFYARLALAQEDHRQLIEEQIACNQPVWATRRSQPIVTTYSNEIHRPGTNDATEFNDYSFVPPSATDADYNRAGAMARALPRNPHLFTPESVYWTAPGLPFRYGQRA